ncbi:MAG: FAD-dependent oxidoreductase, partial [Thermoanaerobaculales bacterium]
GSGAGGGTVAKELGPLCRAGLRVAVLEWGPKLKESEFTGREIEMADRLYVDGGGFLTRDGAMTLAFARAYGGSTVVYTGTSLALPEAVVKRWNVPGIEFDDLARRCAKYLAENNVHLLEDDKINDNNRLFVEACRTLGLHVEQFPVNLKGCHGSGLCNLGCPNAAKQGTNRVQLPAAEAAGVEVVTNCKVERIGERECFATVANPPYGEPSRWAPGRYRIRARAIVVAAGAVNSPALLLRSSLPVPLPALGRYFTTHPALILVGEHERPISNFHGHPKSYVCDHFADSQGFLLETCMYFPFVTAKNLIGFGEEHAELMRHMDRMQMILVLAIDPALAGNRVTVDKEGEPVVDYRLTDPVLDSLVASQRAAARIFFASGCGRVHAPAGARFFVNADQAGQLDELIARRHFPLGTVSITSAHLMGGCRMGSDPATSVTDVWGQVHGLPWLFIADASLFPSSAEINPYVTIMALADRVAERVRAELRHLPAA